MPVDIGGRSHEGKILAYVRILKSTGVPRKEACKETKEFVEDLVTKGSGTVVKSRISALIKKIYGAKGAPKPTEQTLQTAIEPEWAVCGGSLPLKRPVPWTAIPVVSTPAEENLGDQPPPKGILRRRSQQDPLRGQAHKGVSFKTEIYIATIPNKKTLQKHKKNLWYTQSEINMERVMVAREMRGEWCIFPPT